MGRKKNYDPKQKLLQAMALFRKTGFSATSTGQLVEHLGINRKSMYAEFGGKADLFDASLQLYNELNVEQNFGPLETKDAGLDDIKALFEKMAEAAFGPAAGLGCLLCNTALEVSTVDEQSHHRVRSYFNRIRNAFLNALENAQRAGQLVADFDAATTADFFVGHIIGQFTLIRANVAPSIVEGSSRAAIAYLNARSVEPLFHR